MNESLQGRTLKYFAQGRQVGEGVLGGPGEEIPIAIDGPAVVDAAQLGDGEPYPVGPIPFAASGSLTPTWSVS